MEAMGHLGPACDTDATETQATTITQIGGLRADDVASHAARGQTGERAESRTRGLWVSALRLSQICEAATLDFRRMGCRV